MIDLENPVPWRAQETGTSYWNVVGADGVMVASVISKELADRIALARNAFDAMTPEEQAWFLALPESRKDWLMGPKGGAGR